MIFTRLKHNLNWIFATNQAFGSHPYAESTMFCGFKLYYRNMFEHWTHQTLARKKNEKREKLYYQMFHYIEDWWLELCGIVEQEKEKNKKNK